MAIYVAAARQLRRTCRQNALSKVTESQLWVQYLYTLAFFQAGWTATMILLTIFEPKVAELIGIYFSSWDLIDTGIIAGLAYVAYTQRTWGGYGLVLHHLTFIIIKAIEAPNAIEVEASVMLSILAVYVWGSFHLKKLKVASTASVPSAETCEPDTLNAEQRHVESFIMATNFSLPTQASDFSTRELREPRNLSIQCWRCKTEIKVTPEMRGRTRLCPSCATRQVMPL